MKNKKLLALLLAVFSSFAVATTTITACGGGEDVDPDTEQTGGTDDTSGSDTSGSDTSGGDTSGSGTSETHTHTYGEWSVTTVPTETATGVASRSCTAGDDTETITLPALSDSGYTITDNTATDTQAGTGTYTITVDGVTVAFTAATAAEELEGVTYIHSVEEFNSFRTTSGEEPLTGTYKLACDIDLTGVTLEDTTVILAEGGTFDGGGYTISNATYAAGASKQGLLFKTITGGTVTNVKFLNCTVTSTSETASILAGECNGTAAISQIEFNSCSVTTSGNYAGMVFGRREGSTEITITISEITAKNGCSVSCAQYGGFLVGDITSGTNLVFKDLDVEGEFKDSSGNGSFIAGRTRGGTVSVENAVISATMPEKNSIGIFSGNGSLTSLTIKNVLIVESNLSNLYQSTKAPTSESITNLVTVEGVTVDSSTGTGTATAAYLKDTLGFDFDSVWIAEGTSGYRLRSASTNEKSADASITSLTLNTSNAETRIKKGSAFSTDGLSVTGVYSDGTQFVLTENDGYTVDHSAVDVDKTGTYTVTVTSKEDSTVTVTYTVTVVEETGFVVYDEFMTKIYVAGGKIDTANLVVKAVWSDGEEESLTTSEYTVDSSSYSMSAAGTYSVKVSYGSYTAQTIDITVIASAATVTSNQVEVNVVSTQTKQVTESSGVYTFSNVKDAIDFLEACEYDDNVEKIVNIGAGTYTAKITTDLCNLTLIGENTSTSDDKSVLTYSAVESTEDIVNGGTYGLNCATLQVNGSGLTIKNLTIRNDFDYINDASKESSPQGLALTIAGDKAVIENCHLYGNQDTLYLKNGRAYFNATLIEGNVDFIFGQATGIAYFYKCEIRAISRYAEGSEGSNNGYVTAMKADSSTKPDYGYIFYECDFTDDGKIKDGSMSLGRPWGASATVAMINCSFTKAYSTLAYDGSAKSRWYDMSGNSPVNADFCEYGSTGEGAITTAVNGGKVLTATEAANYTLANIFAATNGKCTWSDDWDGTSGSTISYDYTTSCTIDFTTYDGGTIEKTTGEWHGITIDATNGKVKANGNSIQINVGTILKIQSVKGAKVTINWYSGYGGTATTTVDDNGLITIEVTAADNGTPYIVSIVITV